MKRINKSVEDGLDILDEMFDETETSTETAFSAPSDTLLDKGCYLVFDTETSGLNADFNVILQLSYQIRNAENKLIKERDFFFAYPEDRSKISEKAIEVNGLTEEYIASKGITERSAAFNEFYNDVEACGTVVAHNGKFDIKFINASSNREGVNFDDEWSDKLYDTMTSTITLCQLPRKNGGLKQPKLSELAEHLQISYDDLNLHDSASDVELTARCYIELKNRNFINE